MWRWSLCITHCYWLLACHFIDEKPPFGARVWDMYCYERGVLHFLHLHSGEKDACCICLMRDEYYSFIIVEKRAAILFRLLQTMLTRDDGVFSGQRFLHTRYLQMKQNRCRLWTEQELCARCRATVILHPLHLMTIEVDPDPKHSLVWHTIVRIHHDYTVCFEKQLCMGIFIVMIRVTSTPIPASTWFVV